MIFFTTFVTLFTFFSVALSSPVESRALKEYRLQTKIVNNKNDHGSFKGKLWLSAYHTGAGLNDAVLLKNGSEAIKGYLNETIQQFDLGTEFPWFMAMGGDANYAGWEAVQINTFDGVNGFSVNSTGLQWNQTEYGFGGWLACDWWHGVPQLFWLDAYYHFAVPASCSKVDLIPVAV